MERTQVGHVGFVPSSDVPSYPTAGSHFQIVAGRHERSSDHR
jgi:hypothetical protein